MQHDVPRIPESHGAPSRSIPTWEPRTLGCVCVTRRQPSQGYTFIYPRCRVPGLGYNYPSPSYKGMLSRDAVYVHGLPTVTRKTLKPPANRARYAANLCNSVVASLLIIARVEFPIPFEDCTTRIVSCVHVRVYIYNICLYERMYVLLTVLCYEECLLYGFSQLDAPHRWPGVILPTWINSTDIFQVCIVFKNCYDLLKCVIGAIKTIAPLGAKTLAGFIFYCVVTGQGVGILIKCKCRYFQSF